MRHLAAGSLALAGFVFGRDAFAIFTCASLPNPVYLQVGDTQEPLIKALGQQLRASTVNPMTIIYKVSASCTNIDTMYNGTKLTTNASFIPSATEVPGWDPTMPSPTCGVNPAGVPVDLGNSTVLIGACTKTPIPANIVAFQGAIQPYVFVVPKASSEQAMTAEEAYFVFGFGADDMLTPWNDPTFMFIRTTTQTTLVSMAANIDLLPGYWMGQQLGAVSDVVNAVSNPTLTPAEAEKTIGIVGTDVYDQNRSILSSLAFRTFQQHHAYYADSTSGTKDKQNVRDGHYVIWSPTVYMAPVDSDGAFINPRAEYVLDLIANLPATPTPDFDPLATVISAGLVPDCAMKVSRSIEGGDLSLYSPSAPCGCFFESQVGSLSPSCTVCTTDVPCNGGKCRHGYCEAR
jgi:hypothetical protein